MDLTEKPFETADRKKIREKILDIAQKKTVECKESETNELSFPLQTVRPKLNKN